MQPNISRRGSNQQTLWIMLGAGAAAGGYAAWQAWNASQRNPVAFRPGDDAPSRTARGQHTAGRTITIAKPRAELFAFWRDFANLPSFLSSVSHVTVAGDVSRWTLDGGNGREHLLEMRIIEEVPERLIVWRSTEQSEITAEGAVSFRDAPAGRGTEMEAVISYQPRWGGAGRLVSKLLQRDPAIQGRRDLRRFKMLMETGEIATSRNRKD